MKISIVVPSYNQCQFLGATLDSIFSHQDEDVEVIVKDGGSTDGSVDLLRGRSEQFRWTSKKDRGQTDAINEGLRESTGEIVAYLNSDDVYLPGALATIRRAFEDNHERQVVYGDAYHVGVDGSVLDAYPTESWNYPRLLQTCYLCQPAVFWRRSLMERIGVFDERLSFAMDYEYWLRIGTVVPFHYLCGAYLAGSRLHEDTKTLGQRVKVHREIVQVVRRFNSDLAPVLQWLGHLASVTATESGYPWSPFPERHIHHVRLYAGWMLAYAEELNVPLSDAVLAELNTMVESAERVLS